MNLLNGGESKLLEIKIVKTVTAVMDPRFCHMRAFENVNVTQFFEDSKSPVFT